MSDCPHELEFAQRLQAVEDQAKRNEGRIKKLEGETNVIHQLATSVAVMAEQMKSMNQKVDTMTEKVSELEGKPAKRWDALVASIISVGVGAVIGAVFTAIGM